MPSFKRKDTGRWAYRTMVRLPNGKKKRIFGTPERNTKSAADEEEALHIARLKAPPAPDIPTFGEWFDGRFWSEWVLARKNKPSEVESKRSVYEHHLRPRFGDTPLNEIDVAAVAKFRGELVAERDKNGEPVRKEKTVNNILAVLSKALRYAVDVELLPKAPKVGLFKVERPEIEPWEFEEYPRLISAAAGYKPEWHLAALLAGEAGLRIGEVRALRWKDIDLRAGTLTVAQQARHGELGTPKGRTRRVVPLTKPLRAALDAQKTRGHYILSGAELADDDACQWAIETICERAGLPVRRWHTLRHTFGTHLAMLGVNPWRLMTWMGHKRLEETQLYVHQAEAHARPIPRTILKAAGREADPDRRVLLMLGARISAMPVPQKKTTGEKESRGREPTRNKKWPSHRR